MDSVRPTWRIFFLCDEALEFFNCESCPYFLLKGETARRGILDAFYANGLHGVTHARGCCGQKVHEKTGVDAGSENRDSAFFCPGIDGFR